MNEPGIIISIENGIAKVELKRNDACRSCRLCLTGMAPSAMILTAEVPHDARPGDRVRVEIDRRLRATAQLWLLAVPLFAFLLTALFARLVFKVNDALSFLLSIAGMSCAFVGAWLVDRRIGWSARPVARIISIVSKE